MIRFVADTNVIISATIVKEGASNQILQAWRRRLAEYQGIKIVSPVEFLKMLKKRTSAT